jgi:predicted ATPase/DNA-binding CsgD family transcriptional regulator
MPRLAGGHLAGVASWSGWLSGASGRFSGKTVVVRSVPVPLTSLVGRSEERREVLGALGQHRLVTLAGTGGVGKTRLAQEVGRAHHGDVAWVDLASLGDQMLVGATVVRALGLTEAPAGDAAAVVTDAVGDSELLLVVDNCEHLLDAVAGLLEASLVSCPSLRILATSREPLRVAGEFVFLVPPLPVAAVGDELPDAVRLFADRARLAGARLEFTDGTAAEVASLCRRLDGIPLAIELAAARVRGLGVSQILASLDDVLGVLTGGARVGLARHRTLEQSVAWSYDLLDGCEQALFRRLAVFAGEFSLPGVVAVAVGDPIVPGQVLDLLAALVDKSLLQPTFRAGRARYRLLEVVRQFARRQLDAAGETVDVHARHAAWVAGEVERRSPLLFGDRILEVLEDLEEDLDDIRAAAAWARAGGKHALALRLLCAPLLLWICRYPAEGRQRVEAALETEEQVDAGILARAQLAASWLSLYVFESQSSKAHAWRALTLAADLGGVVVQAQARTLLGWNALFLAPATAGPILAAAAGESRAAGDHHHLAHALAGLGFLSAHQGKADDALGYLGESLVVARQAGDQVGIRRALAFSGVLLAARGSFAEAEARFGECERITRGLGDRYFLSQALDYLGFVALHRGQLEAARTRIEESLAIAHRSNPVALGRSHSMAALLQLALGEHDLAVIHADQALAIVRDKGLNWYFSMTFGIAAEAYRGAGRGDDADSLLAEGLARARAVGLAWAEAAAAAASDRADALLTAVGGLARLGHAPELIRALEALAVVLGPAAAAPGAATEIARLLGGTAAARRRLGLVPFPADRYRLAAAAGQLEGLLGKVRWAEEVERGGTQSLDDLVHRVLRMRGPRHRTLTGWDSLTPAERRVAELAAAGLRNAEIAGKLFVAPGTVKIHLSHVFAKLGVRTRTELSAAYTRQRGE